MAEPRVIHSGSLDGDREAAYERRREQLRQKLARGLESTRVDWSPTEGSEDIQKEARDHRAAATDGLRKILARAAATEVAIDEDEG